MSYTNNKLVLIINVCLMLIFIYMLTNTACKKKKNSKNYNIVNLWNNLAVKNFFFIYIFFLCSLRQKYSKNSRIV